MIIKRPFDIYYPYTAPTQLGIRPYKWSCRPIKYVLELIKYQVDEIHFFFRTSARLYNRLVNCTN